MKHEAAWVEEYARTASAIWRDDIVRIRNVRHFTYRARDDYTPSYFDADYDLARLHSVDLVVSRWAHDSIAHVFVSFGFDDGRYLSISIETRRRIGQHYSTWKGFFRNYDLIYVVADERDLIGVRTDVRRERVNLYRADVSPDTARALFRDYLLRVNQLNERPEHYHTLFNNCTTNILRHARTIAPHMRYSWKVLLSGHADDYSYRLGLLGHACSFEELKRRSLITRPDDASIGDDFSHVIRQIA
ncbi:DUF4105 domain-containing protein [Caballeronia sp. LZ065]|uniref:Lnb N-terminal periplasmic domain-containing protein n=1 Tax=Caballeronia sp. LZ065 TaxID=3038571 RepID=UPI002860632A|nr:DUF4105 domain-containing protein [Caballeronia sp. LZ065]MDR5781021.1 DUF4105 domain-containing protein [Caballeronia sp. LZ065]